MEELRLETANVFMFIYQNSLIFMNALFSD